MKYWPYFSTAVTTAASLYDTYTGGSGQSLVRQYRDLTRPAYKQRRKTTTGTVVENKRKNNKMSNGTYSMSRRKYWRGTKLPPAKYIDRLSRTAVVHQIERFSKVSDAAGTVGTNRGSTWLSYGDAATTYSVADVDSQTLVANQTYTEYPVHMFNLSGTRCNPNPSGTITIQARCGWKLGINNTVASPLINKVTWLPNNGYDRNTVINPNSYPIPTNQEWEVEDTGGLATGAGREVGRSALMEWTEIRMLFYGKVTRPTYIKASFVMFKDPKFAPDWEYYRNGFNNLRCVQNLASEYWKTVVQPLVNNPCTITIRTADTNPLIVLDSKTIKIAPKDTSDADTDPHQQFVRWFNRWNRVVNYSYESIAQLTNAQVQDPQLYPNVATDVAVAGVAKLPLGLKGSVYLMLTSYQPDAQPIAVDGTGPTNGITASYDFNIRKSTGIMTV